MDIRQFTEGMMWLTHRYTYLYEKRGKTQEEEREWEALGRMDAFFMMVAGFGAGNRSLADTIDRIDLHRSLIEAAEALGKVI
jgi:hypothetical protein